MAKNKNKVNNLASINAAKKAKEETKVDNNVKETKEKPEAPKEEKKPTPTKETKPEVKKPEAKAEKPKAEEKPQKKDKKVPTFIPEEVDTTKKAVERASKLGQIPIGSTGTSIDGKAMLAYVMHERYGKNEELRKNYPELYEDINRNIDVVSLLALVDVRQDLLKRGETGQLKLTISADQIMPLQTMAGMLGIELAPIKALPPVGDQKQLEINFSESKVPEELAKDAGNTGLEKPELDPNKITTEEQIKDALDYLLRAERNVAVGLVNTVEWYRTLRINQEKNADKKLALDDKTVEDWLNEIFTITKPVSLIKGLGRTLYLYTSQLGSPIFSHALLHHYISKVGWSEEQIASVLKVLVQENVRLDLQDDPNKKESKAFNAISGSIGTKYITDLFNNANVNIDEIPADQKNAFENLIRDSKKILGAVRTNYFEKDKAPTTDELRMKIGQIINLYRDPANRLAEYEQSSLTSPTEGEYPETKKEETEKKS